jgi:nitrate reductase cytochrome c-type subunit
MCCAVQCRAFLLQHITYEKILHKLLQEIQRSSSQCFNSVHITNTSTDKHISKRYFVTEESRVNTACSTRRYLRLIMECIQNHVHEEFKARIHGNQCITVIYIGKHITACFV